ncbi:hypothetical protein L3V82_07145 [Thiotrichales bacterium 19S3-7]|nr:hypothetical protein [Thiotrichales bacterium 19S3-7]MCF6801934.1 hypothetical protein [Thiotrichales bacterium 19S3-11]
MFEDHIYKNDDYIQNKINAKVQQPVAEILMHNMASGKKLLTSVLKHAYSGMIQLRVENNEYTRHTFNCPNREYLHKAALEFVGTLSDGNSESILGLNHALDKDHIPLSKKAANEMILGLKLRSNGTIFDVAKQEINIALAFLDDGEHIGFMAHMVNAMVHFSHGSLQEYKNVKFSPQLVGTNTSYQLQNAPKPFSEEQTENPSYKFQLHKIQS